MTAKPQHEPIWTPFQYPIYRMLWITSVISNIGSWMHDVSAAWLMTTLTTNPLLVAGVQAITAFSVCLLALPAGALADIIDKRRHLIILQTWMMLVSGTLAIFCYVGHITPESLLFFTFCLGAGTALNAPTWQSIVPELVPAKKLRLAITLNSMGMNLARTLGPALAGVIIAILGPAAVFALNSVSFIGIIIALSSWKREVRISTLPTERFFGAMRAGVRYVKGSPALQIVLVKTSALFLFVSAFWALLPLVTRTILHQGPVSYGILLAMIGLGAVMGALVIQRIREYFNLDKLIFSGAVVFSISMMTLALSQNFYFSCIASFFVGIEWIVVISSLNAVVQEMVPSWVRARAMAVYLMMFYGGMACGSVIWGWIAMHHGITTAIMIAAIGVLVTNIFTYFLALDGNINYDHTPSMDLPAPYAQRALSHDEGPVMITVEYHVDPENVKGFTQAIEELKHTRVREGAFFWTLFNDVEDPKRFLECFMVESWLEHLRFHERVSVSDRKIQAKVNTFLIAQKRPHTTHFVAYKSDKRKRFKKN